MQKSKSISAIAIALACVTAGCAKAPSPDAVFLVVVDTLRPDRLACYGYEFCETPAFDRLAREGVRFERAYSVASWTIPSMGAMMTSLYPTQLGLVEVPVPADSTLGWRQRRPQVAYTLAEEEHTLAEMMGAAGYRTAAFVNQPGINGGEGFVQGFDDWYYPEDTETIKRYDASNPLVSKSWPPYLKQARLLDLRLVEEFDGWLERNSGEKMFVWIHLLTPHRPYNPPPWTKRRTSSTLERFAPTTQSDAYDGEVVAVDELIGKILDSIDTRVGKERSAIILTSDHGEAFGEHGMEEHGHTLHNEVLQVPMIIRTPSAPAGVTVKSAVRTIDILPTILEVAGAESHAPGDGNGESLVPLLAGPGANRAVYSEGMLYGSTERSIMVSGMKLMVDVQEEKDMLYNTVFDSGELADVRAAHEALADSLMGVLASLHEELVADFARRAGPRAPSAAESERIQKAMKSLGYVGTADGE